MRRAARTLLLLAPLVLVLAACGGGEDKGSGNPLVDAAEATAAAGSETTETSAKVTYPGTELDLEGQGGYNHATDEGWQTLTIRLPAGTGQMDQIFVRNMLCMKSEEIFGNTLPSGKQWLKYDVNKAGPDSGFNFKALLGQTPADVLWQLQRTAEPVQEIGPELVGGEEMTHYRATIDPRKVPRADNLQALSKAVYKPVDVWVDEDGRVRQVKLDYTARVDPAADLRGRVQLTMKLAGFGSAVDVQPPAAGLVVDSTDIAEQGG